MGQAELSSRIHRTVQVVCGLLAVEKPERPLDEEELRSEVVACILTSQVTASSAESAFNRLKTAGLLSDARWESSDSHFESDVATCLTSTGEGSGGYRFPKAKASQIAALRVALRDASLVEMIQGDADVVLLRRKLVSLLPGVGPKQASMFLRNVGLTYSLAILDAHVLRFLAATGMIENEKENLSSLSRYELVEAHAIRYATSCGHDVGYLDWAIWITMKALREMRR